MVKWKIGSVIIPEGIYVPEIKGGEESKLQRLLDEGFEPFAVGQDTIWLKMPVDS